ncbi:MAG: DNA polymerase III subunit gamma/tau [Thiohalomonadales bacterium]
MTYQVLARKWRPQNFAELVGQQHVQRALTNALENDRLHHAYLFTGTRGVGKTTIARILAKSLNCETAVTATPCGQCGACREISEGRFVDLIEVDAASRTKVEDTRELLDNVQYAPTKGRYKVYLIDEVHMLSNHSFNALLKTLEEPPPHVKFLLATTDPQRLPVTVLSRCLQFHLKRLTVPEIYKHLCHILDTESVPYETQAITPIARSADGSIRDALSLLDQAISYGAGSLQESDVLNMLGAIDHRDISDLLEAITLSIPEAILTAINHIAEYSMEFDQVLSDLISAFHQIALLQLSPQSVDTSKDNFEQLEKLAQQISQEDIQLYYQIALIGRRDLALTPDSKMGIEMTLLRMLAFKPADQNFSSPLPKPQSKSQPKPSIQEPRPASAQQEQGSTLTPKPAPKSLSNQSSERSADVDTDTLKTPPPVTHLDSESDINWENIANRLALTGMAKQLALNCSLLEYDKDKLTLQLNKNQSHLLSDSRADSVADALRSILPNTILRIQLAKEKLIDTPAELNDQRQQHRIKSAVEDISGDQAVQQFKELFDATISTGSIEPIER